ncbi:3594_t:CDS:2 [Cetraspora pellucida]|uniref:3594_t:CDS:1 n=1 Tax=Cetraspora pellucida TaxID=1433469 RepID=A0ACA9LQU7_9GLOM|nr:3594_t:CDS:2 [Cetraspora pellucida]
MVEDSSENEGDESTGPSYFSKNYDYESIGGSSSESDSEVDSESEYICNDNFNTEITTMLEDPIQKIFEKLCNLPVKKPYYSAGIYPIVCYQCGSKETHKLEEKHKRPLCDNCGGNITPKK